MVFSGSYNKSKKSIISKKTLKVVPIDFLIITKCLLIIPIINQNFIHNGADNANANNE